MTYLRCAHPTKVHVEAILRQRLDVLAQSGHDVPADRTWLAVRAGRLAVRAWRLHTWCMHPYATCKRWLARMYHGQLPPQTPDSYRVAAELDDVAQVDAEGGDPRDGVTAGGRQRRHERRIRQSAAGAAAERKLAQG